jgi:Lrp/AsnC family leucine-responsive transcriptional regulator
MSKKLDVLDLRILSELQRDGRATISSLAENVGSSRPTVTNRLRRLLEDELAVIQGGLNLQKFGFKMACVGLEVKKDATRKEVEHLLKSCPRVLNVFRTPEKANFHLAVWGEDDQTINSTIESYRDKTGVDIVYTHYLGTPIHGDIAIRVQPNKGSETPCGMSCKECHRYENDWCTGCPVTADYKDPILD